MSMFGWWWWFRFFFSFMFFFVWFIRGLITFFFVIIIQINFWCIFGPPIENNSYLEIEPGFFSFFPIEYLVYFSIVWHVFYTIICWLLCFFFIFFIFWFNKVITSAKQVTHTHTHKQYFQSATYWIQNRKTRLIVHKIIFSVKDKTSEQFRFMFTICQSWWVQNHRLLICCCLFIIRYIEKVVYI